MTRAATHGAREGGWYWECEILHPENEKGHVPVPQTFPPAHARARAPCVTREARGRSATRARSVGWAQRSGELQAPVGYDKWSYGVPRPPGLQAAQQRSNRRFGELFGERARSP